MKRYFYVFESIIRSGEGQKIICEQKLSPLNQLSRKANGIPAAYGVGTPGKCKDISTEIRTGNLMQWYSAYSLSKHTGRCGINEMLRYRMRWRITVPHQCELCCAIFDDQLHMQHKVYFSTNEVWKVIINSVNKVAHKVSCALRKNRFHMTINQNLNR